MNQTDLVVKDSIFSFQNEASGFHGLVLSSSTNTLIQNCIFTNNAGDGFSDGLNSNGLVVQNCIAYQNGFSGFSISTNGAVVTECNAVNTDTGFQLNSPGHISLFNCTATNNTDEGFFIFESSPGTGISFWLENCTANNNAIGFSQTAMNPTGTIKSCSASNNTGCGFSDVNGSPVHYASNYSADNGTNYCVAGADPGTGVLPYYYVTPIAGAAYWDNVSPV